MPLTRCSSASSSTSYSAGFSAGRVRSRGLGVASAAGSLGRASAGVSAASVPRQRCLGAGASARGLLRGGLLLGGGGASVGGSSTGGADGRLVEGLLVRLGRRDPHGRRRGLALELLPVAGHPEDGGDGLGRLRADAEPVLRPLGVDLDEGGVLLRVVLADRLDRAAVTLGAGVGDDDAVVRRAHLAQAHELDLGGHGGWCTPRTLDRCARRGDVWGYAGAEPWTRPATVRGPPPPCSTGHCARRARERRPAAASGRADASGPASAPDGGQHAGGGLGDRDLLARVGRPVAELDRRPRRGRGPR